MRFKIATASHLGMGCSDYDAALTRICVRLAAFIALSMAAFSSVQAQMLRDGDDFWIINTRGISSRVCNADLQNPRLSITQYQPGIGYETRQIDELLGMMAADRDALNVLYVHGNRATSCDAMSRAWTVYGRVRSRCTQPQRVRWILWSWPSDPISGPLKDARTKAPRADTQALYVGWFLRRLPCVDRLQMVGYSFGGRVLTGSLHSAAGGSIGHRKLDGPPLHGARITVSLVAPAVDRNWLRQGRTHGLASQNMGSLNLFYNNRDRVLMLYHLINQFYNPVALGFKGLGGIAPREDGLPVSTYCKNCTRSVGLLHDELKYYQPCCNAAKRIAQAFDDACRMNHAGEERQVSSGSLVEETAISALPVSQENLES